MWDFRELQVWQRARALVRDVYLVSEHFPPDERFGITAQVRRCAISVPANIAEGCGRRGRRELARFVDVATGSAYELESHLLIARDLALVKSDDISPLLAEVDELKRMLIGLSRSLRASE